MPGLRVSSARLHQAAAQAVESAVAFLRSRGVHCDGQGITCEYRGADDEGAALHSGSFVVFRWSVKGVDGSLETRLRAARALREKRYAAMLPRALRVSLLGCFAPQMVADKRMLLGMKHDNVSEVKCTAIAVPRTCIGRVALTPDRLMIRCAEVDEGEWLCHPADLPFKMSRLSGHNIRAAPSAKRL